ncbi:hypothetical protein AVEN_4044-1 [Araneus ventricosus]|uniref:Reverse transcriptase domain-containing protein n=1 Tax=Araneus ventricosus TaxID=182803 RepID=A0A4Y2MEC3_ARAVE|nr:hypothetical protein AVEN_4044-1 [Araneus ventricosus]
MEKKLRANLPAFSLQGDGSDLTLVKGVQLAVNCILESQDELSSSDHEEIPYSYWNRTKPHPKASSHEKPALRAKRTSLKISYRRRKIHTNPAAYKYTSKTIFPSDLFKIYGPSRKKVTPCPSQTEFLKSLHPQTSSPLPTPALEPNSQRRSLTKTKGKVAINTSQGPATWNQQQGCPQGSCTGPAFWNLVADEVLQQDWFSRGAPAGICR